MRCQRLKTRFRLEAKRRGHEEVSICRVAVLRIIVPLPAGWIIAVHQQAGLAAHLAVEIFHTELFAAIRPGGELVLGAQEPAVGENLDVVLKD